MVYLDNAATTYPKPPQVVAALRNSVVEYGGNPGRAGHSLSIKTAEAVFAAREKCADFFGAKVENTIFTLNCTYALNMAIKGILGGEKPYPGNKAGFAHCIISDIEHNAAARPIHALAQSGRVKYSLAATFDTAFPLDTESSGNSMTTAKTSNNDDETVKSFESLITTGTKVIVCTAASNVTGKVLPYERIGALCQKKGICFILDAAQGGGVLDIKIGNGINFICCSGHKGLYGPMGTGLLITDGKYNLHTLIEGGTGSNSRDLNQPDGLPDRLESGTINTPGVIALGAGIDFVKKIGMERIHTHERKLCELFIEQVKNNKKVKLYFDELVEGHLPLVPFNVEGMESYETAQLLSEAGYCLRGGLHCSPLAHKKMNTLEKGVVRMAPSAFNTKKEVIGLARRLESI
ncbi:MAG: aminotransferase class V-fold PLP-dependent enzyme [Oscillospiraceae bacterium]|nr:aminotransferase class V-fold PLP-dependent enzyme [Oscillospiraceae bacterium]